ncbi:MAG TPA: hypothetical protein VHB98_00715 [Chloroflexota bacterium]|nr:hypothetical protein [Chloroflexota bacterium]
MTTDAIARAQQFFQQHGRDIDRARFAYHFQHGSQNDLLDVLARYQNADGGFGHGLEPDIGAPDSNPFAAELALLICLQAEVPRDHPLPARTVAYLEHTQDDDGGWRFADGVYAHALAPWFQGWQWPSLNPACTIAGLLKELALGSATLHAGVEQLFTRLARLEDVAGDDFYGVRPYAYYFLPTWEHPRRDLYLAGVLWWLIRQHLSGSLADSDHFFAYVRTPRTYTGRLLPASLLAERLDQLVAEQAEDGGWPSPYNAHWRGWTTVQSLLVLRAFGRLQGW